MEKQKYSPEFDSDIYVIDSIPIVESDFRHEIVVLPATVVSYSNDYVVAESEYGLKFYHVKDYGKYFFDKFENANKYALNLSKIKGSEFKINEHSNIIKRFVSNSFYYNKKELNSKSYSKRLLKKFN